MTNIRNAVLWWDQWQLRILVLGSLGLQWFLLLGAPMRKYTIPRLFKTFIWLAYISSDALAIYALATLFNRHARASSNCEYWGKARSLEVLWAPLLLVHLGGREEITAYNIEDNELWTRHTVTLVSQVTVAVYAFCKSWPSDGDRRLLVSAILLFINGIINFCEKPWALRSASINRLVAVSSIIKGERRKPRGWERCFTELDDRYKCWNEMPQQPAPILSEVDRVQMILSDMSLLAVTNELHKQKKSDDQILVRLDPAVPAHKQMKLWLRRAFELIYTRANVTYTPAYLACNFLLVPALHIAAITLFALSHKQGYNVTDVKITYILTCFTAVLDVLGVFISKLVYKLMSVAEVPPLCMTLPDSNLVNSVLRRMETVTGWLLKCATGFGYKEDYFHFHHDNIYGKIADFFVATLMKEDVKGLDLASYRSRTKNWALGKDLLNRLLDSCPNKPYPDSPVTETDPTNLITETNPTNPVTETNPTNPVTETNPTNLVTETDPANLITETNPTNPVTETNPTNPVTETNPTNPVTKTNSTNPNTKTNPTTTKNILLESLRVPFDESVLLWHVATDLCFRAKPPMGFRCRPCHDEVLREICTEAISNYMAHLLNFRPDMLMTGSRQHLFTHTMNSLEALFRDKEKEKKKEASSQDEEEEKKKAKPLDIQHDPRHVEEIINEGVKNSKYPLIHDACKLAKELIDLPDKEMRWKLMYRVWVGMLCYSASMCRGYLHAKSLGEGGEFLSFAWLVISVKGAKTLADKLQLPESEEGDDVEEKFEEVKI